jgi:2',3'-cyclic-nucleotide 2'-phosphodiesterase (5'-nucleotidase family)
MPNKLLSTFLFLLILISCSETKNFSKVETSEYVLKDTVSLPEDSIIAAHIRPFAEKMESDLGIILVQSSAVLEKGVPESLLGNFVSDLCFHRIQREYEPQDGLLADFAFFNNGGLRKPLPQGKITKRDVYELMPFENELVILTLDGRIVKKLLNFIASMGGAPVSGLRFVIKDKEAIDIIIGGSTFDSTRTYKVVTSDYLANGGDNYSFLSESILRESTSIKIRDAIIQHLYIMGKTEEIVQVSLDGRIRNE